MNEEWEKVIYSSIILHSAFSSAYEANTYTLWQYNIYMETYYYYACESTSETVDKIRTIQH